MTFTSEIRAALCTSPVASCTRAEVNPIEYLADVLDRIDRVPHDELAGMHPHRWRPRRVSAVEVHRVTVRCRATQ